MSIRTYYDYYHTSLVVNYNVKVTTFTTVWIPHAGNIMQKATISWHKLSSNTEQLCAVIQWLRGLYTYIEFPMIVS